MSQREFSKQVRLVWPLENHLPQVHANYFQYVAMESEVILVFGSFLPTGLQGRQQKEIDEFFAEATIRPEAKIVMSQKAFRSLYELLKEFFEKSEAKEDENDSDNSSDT